jgi:hypothetical protein
MSNYVITFYNEERVEWRSEDVDKQTFAEAVVRANNRRVTLGYEWEISCISKTLKDEDTYPS